MKLVINGIVEKDLKENRDIPKFNWIGCKLPLKPNCLKVEELILEKRIGTARNYSGIIGRLKVFTNDRDLKFNELNLEFLKRFERHHLSKPGNTINGIASYMRTIKAIYNKGIKEGMVDESLYPFKYYTIKTRPTQKRAIKLESIKKILEMETEVSSNHFHYRNYFILSYLMLGISFIDMAFLKRDNIIDGRVKFQSEKQENDMI